MSIIINCKLCGFDYHEGFFVWNENEFICLDCDSEKNRLTLSVDFE